MPAIHAAYPVGTPGQPWNAADKAAWRARQSKQRSYADDVLTAIERFRGRFDVAQYGELDYGADGIRANAVNADRIRSGLLTDDFIRERSKARGVSEKDYMTGNLLGREVTADDVAQAFLAQALALKTTADVTTVDGGNIAAALR